MNTNTADRAITIINTVQNYARTRKNLLASINKWAAFSEDIELERAGVRCKCAPIVGRMEVEAIEEAEGDAEEFIKAHAAMEAFGLQTYPALLRLAENVRDGGLYKNSRSH